jgi:hypothetical protein
MALLFTLHTHFALCNLDIEDIEDRVSSEHTLFDVALAKSHSELNMLLGLAIVSYSTH